MIDGNKHSPRSKRRNRVAVVTGGDSGVGLQVARGLLRAGYRVYVGKWFKPAVSSYFIPI